MLPDNRGWSWGQTGRRVEMRFDPPLASLFFERGSKTQIRAFFYKGRFPKDPALRRDPDCVWRYGDWPNDGGTIRVG